MIRALLHRGPDEGGELIRPGLGLASRRLSIVGLEDGQQPIFNEDGHVAVVYNGELFDYPEQRLRLEGLGHQFRTRCDTEVLVHLWEQHGPEMFQHLRGQFAFALVDFRQRTLILARDQLGICPLYWARRDDKLYFGSEIKALLASGRVCAEIDPLGLDHVFSFFAVGTRRTMFAGVSALLPGTFLEIRLPSSDRPAQVTEHRYWKLDFPDEGHEDGGSPEKLVAEFGALLEDAVRLRLRADVPVVSYLSGGVDSTTVTLLASRQLKRPIPTFTIRIQHPKLDETDRALLAAGLISSPPTVVSCGEAEIAAGYRDLVIASECPVIDTSSAAIYQLAAAVRRAGYKVALSGEGADEALAGYPWFKANRLISQVDRVGVADRWRRFVFARASHHSWERYQKRYRQMGGYHATSDLYAACSLSGDGVYSKDFETRLEGRTATDDLALNLERMKRWHPLNRSLYLGYQVMLPGLLMTHKGDRPAMANSVETRFPFLDLELVEFCARLAPEFKLRNLRRDKDLLRRYAGGLLPPEIAQRPKNIFRARYSGSFLEPEPPFVQQLLSAESLKKTGYFDPEKVRRIRQHLKNYPGVLPPHMGWEVSFVGVLATQVWHHLFLGGGLCELDSWSP
jgi:asparagine synthase (glutamine-hydrolysing)